MAVNSRAKGNRGEREWAKMCRDHGYGEARRGQQYCGIAGDADVVGVPGFHLEIKRVERLNIHDAMAQAIGDAAPGDTPVVCHRKDRTEWLVTMRAEDWFGILTHPDDKDDFDRAIGRMEELIRQDVWNESVEDKNDD